MLWSIAFSSIEEFRDWLLIQCLRVHLIVHLKPTLFPILECPAIPTWPPIIHHSPILVELAIQLEQPWYVNLFHHCVLFVSDCLIWHHYALMVAPIVARSTQVLAPISTLSSRIHNSDLQESYRIRSEWEQNQIHRLQSLHLSEGYIHYRCGSHDKHLHWRNSKQLLPIFTPSPTKVVVVNLSIISDNGIFTDIGKRHWCIRSRQFWRWGNES